MYAHHTCSMLFLDTLGDLPLCVCMCLCVRFLWGCCAADGMPWAVALQTLAGGEAHECMMQDGWLHSSFAIAV